MEENATDPFAGQDPWKYSNSWELNNGPYWGTLTMYKGGGYTINFKRNAAMTLKVRTMECYIMVTVRASRTNHKSTVCSTISQE